jgi:hypothetical protein
MSSKRNVGLALVAGASLLACVLIVQKVLADGKPSIQLNVESAAPRQVDDSVQQAIVRDYSAAWQSLASALATNSESALKDDFIGYALDKLTQRVKDQRQSGLTTRIVDRGHQVEAIFYSLDGSAMQLRDRAALETEILEGGTVIHSERAQLTYYVIMTGAEDRWKVRVLDSAAEEPTPQAPQSSKKHKD